MNRCFGEAAITGQAAELCRSQPRIADENDWTNDTDTSGNPQDLSSEFQGLRHSGLPEFWACSNFL